MRTIKASIVVFSLLVFAVTSQIPMIQATEGKAWAVIVCGTNDGKAESALIYDVLTEVYTSFRRLWI